ncbi:hypothetical protein QP192_26305, partial [Escherichia coli]|nr:hypothetical protein [Escherichia coli]
VAISRLNKVAPQLEKLRKQIKEYEETEKEVKKVLYEKMTENDIKQWKTPQVTVTRILPKKQHRFDSTRFKKDRPELYEDYVKESETKGYGTL